MADRTGLMIYHVSNEKSCFLYCYDIIVQLCTPANCIKSDIKWLNLRADQPLLFMAKYYPTRRPQNGSITIYYIHKQEKTHFFIGKVVKKSKDWIVPVDPETKEILGDGQVRKGVKGADEINEAIKREKKIIQKIVGELEEEGLQPTTTLVKDRYDKLEEAKKKATEELESGITANKFDIMAGAWEWWKAGRGPKKTWERSTKQSIKESLDAFETYIEKIKPGKKLLKSHLTLDLIRDYEKHLFSKGHVKNHVGKRLKQLRQYLSTCDGLGFDLKKIKIYQIAKEPIALTEGELTKLENIDLSQNTLWDQCRDMFLLGCYTSLRISDLKRLGPQHFHENEIRIDQQKNKKSYRFPMTPQIKRVLEKYSYSLPKVSEAEINKNIKEVAAKAKINQPVELTIEKADHTLRVTKKKCEIIGTHMAVKTFITLGLSWGVSIPEIAYIVGKHIRTIQSHYAGVDKEKASEKLRDLWEQRQHLKVI